MSHPVDYSLVAGASLEGLLSLAGVILLVRWFRHPPRTPPALTPWPGSGSDFLLLFLLAVVGGIAVPQAAGLALRHAALSADARDVVGALCFQTGLLGGIAIFHFGFGRGLGDRAAGPGSAWRSGAATVLIAFPLIFGVTLAWQNALLWLGVPVQTQDRVQTLIDLHSWTLRVLYVGMATVLAPIAEEALFRAGVFRYLRSRAPRGVAIWTSALVFGILHVDFRAPVASLGTLVPLVVLGAIFAAAYERTGRIGTTMVAHGLFNLSTVVLVALGVNT